MTWTGAPSMVEPLAFRALPSLCMWKYRRIRRTEVCGCRPCLNWHWEFIHSTLDEQRRDRYGLWSRLGDGTTCVCESLRPPSTEAGR